jgi:hypothetical protein
MPWLAPTNDGTSKKGATLAVVEWQSDGPLEYGPELEQRFKRGKLCRLLRGLGFGIVRILQSHPSYYIVGAVKSPPVPQPHAGEFVTVATLDELPKNGMKQVELFGQPIIVANTGQEIVRRIHEPPPSGMRAANYLRLALLYVECLHR